MQAARTIHALQPIFIQISNERGLRYLERVELDRPVNCYTRKRDQTGAHLLRIGFEDDAGEYGGHAYIVRAHDYALSKAAEAIVRKRIGFPD